MSENPYAPPRTVVSPVEALDPEALRKMYLGHEALVRGMSGFFNVSGYLLGLLAVTFALTGFSGSAQSSQTLAASGGTGLLAGLSFWVGGQFKHLTRCVRGVGTAAGVLCLLIVPMGTLVGVWLLRVLYSQRGSMVFSEEYRELMRETSDIVCAPKIVGPSVLGAIIVGNVIMWRVVCF